jgi:hypothetical protein
MRAIRTAGHWHACGGGLQAPKPTGRAVTTGFGQCLQLQTMNEMAVRGPATTAAPAKRKLAALYGRASPVTSSGKNNSNHRCNFKILTFNEQKKGQN